ncbi:MAG: TetR/AcrR family transcriptional regulator C-terminal ligand-binding domain-containing protein [Steroidobacteraceae bacterium]
MKDATDPPARRPGGRSNRVRAAVFAAVEALLAEQPDSLPSMAAIAERAGVNPASLYKRWKEPRLLAAEVAAERLVRALPVPDTGTLRGDLVGWAQAAASSLMSDRDVTMLRVMMSAPRTTTPFEDLRQLPVARRLDELQQMLERAQERGEATPTLRDVLELVLAPIYLHALFIGSTQALGGVERLVDRTLATTTPAPWSPN